MEAIFHIITDIPCTVLHFGKRVAEAKPDEDTVISLLKGKHLLSFVSTENPTDMYKIVFEVPEAGIESFIEVKLSPYRNRRLEQEEKQRIAEQEEKRKREEEEIERQRRIRIAEEQRRAQVEKENKEAEMRRQKHLFFTNECESLNNYLSNLYTTINRKNKYPVAPITKGDNGKFGVLRRKYDDTTYFVIDPEPVENAEEHWIIPPKYDYATPFCFGVTMVGEIVETKPGFFDWVYSYVRSNGEVLCALKKEEQGLPFELGLGIILQKDSRLSPKNLRIIDTEGGILFEKPLSEVLSIYSKRSEFPLSIKVEGNICKRLHFSYKSIEYQKRLQVPFVRPFIPWHLIVFNKNELSFEQLHSSPEILKNNSRHQNEYLDYIDC